MGDAGEEPERQDEKIERKAKSSKSPTKMTNAHVAALLFVVMGASLYPLTELSFFVSGGRPAPNMTGDRKSTSTFWAMKTTAAKRVAERFCRA